MGQTEPEQLGPNLWQADNGGRLFARTVLPEKPRYSLVGGPGKEFFASGRNWPVVDPETPDWDKQFKVTGKWRLEVSDPEVKTANRFLTVLEAALPDRAQAFDAGLFRTDRTDGVRFTDRGGTRWELEFNRTGEIGCRIVQTAPDGKVVFNNALPNQIEPKVAN